MGTRGACRDARRCSGNADRDSHWIGSTVIAAHSVSAAEILHRARAVAIAPTRGGVRSFTLIEQTYIRPGNSGLGLCRRARNRPDHEYSLVSGPNRWRTERRYHSLPSNPLIRNSYGYPTLEVSDGKTYSSYDARARLIETHRLFPGQNGIYDLLPSAAEPQV
jgi:hypothetical protein